MVPRVSDGNGQPRRRSRPDQSTRDKILGAAAAVLADEGVTAVSTRRVAGRAGVNQALVHYHFGSIENLLLEVLRSQALVAAERAHAQYGGGGDFVDKWRADIDAALGDVALGWGKAWLQIMALVVNDEAMLRAYREEFAPPNYSAILDAAVRSMPESEVEDAEAVTALASLLKIGLIVNALLGRLPGEDRAVDLAAEFLRQRTGRPETVDTPRRTR
jgi:AcrR family transcriptional regulator